MASLSVFFFLAALCGVAIALANPGPMSMKLDSEDNFENGDLVKDDLSVVSDQMATMRPINNCRQDRRNLAEFGYRPFAIANPHATGLVQLSYRQERNKIRVEGEALNGLRLRHFNARVSTNPDLTKKDLRKKFVPGLDVTIARATNYGRIKVPDGTTTCCDLIVYIYVRFRLCDENQNCPRKGEFFQKYNIALSC